MSIPQKSPLSDGPQKDYSAHAKQVNAFLEQQRLRLKIDSANIYVPRSLFKVNDDTDQSWFLQTRQQYLKDVLNKSGKLVLMGGAGSGKSFELLQLVLQYKDDKGAYIPFFIRMNSFQGEDLQNYLPAEWELVPENKCLVLLDGLDEVPQLLFEKAISAIDLFSLSNPNITIIVSCRTNVLAIEKSGRDNRLTHFFFYTISDLQIDQIEQFSRITLGERTSDFLREVQAYHFEDLACKPFFLIVLIETFNIEAALSSGRSEIMLRFVQKHIHQDVVRYSQENEEKVLQKDVIRLLQRCALVMECAGRNYLTDAEMQDVVRTRTKYQYIQYFSLFRKYPVPGGFHWMFEHNNIQEFLAARSLHDRPFEEIKGFLSSSSKKDFIKPTWLNTLSFLISLVDNNLKKSLLNWMAEVNPELMVKMERERVDEDIRLWVLKFIVEEYKLKNIWLFSSYFSTSELAQFCASTDSFNYLYEELTDPETSRFNRINALSIIREFPSFDMEQQSRLEPAIIQLLRDCQNYPDILHHILASVVKLGLHKGNFPLRLMALLKDRRNAYVRSGMYRIIQATGTENEQIDYILEGANIAISGDKTDRGDVPLLDEAFLFNQLFQQFNQRETLRKEVAYFQGNVQILHSFIFHEIKDVFAAIVKHGIQLYPNDSELYEVFVGLIKDVCSSTREELVSIIIQFFRQTGTDRRLFADLWGGKAVKPYIRSMLLAMLANASIAKDFTDEYHAGKKTDVEVEELLHILDGNIFFADKLPQKKLLIQQIEQATDIVLPVKLQMDYSEAIALKKQQDFLLLFNQEAFIGKIKEVYVRLGKNMLNWQDIRNDASTGNYLSPDTAPTPVIRFINGFSDNNTKLHLQAALSWASERNIFEPFAIKEIYEYLLNDKNVKVTSEQTNYISNWCLTHGELLTIQDGQLFYNGNPLNYYNDKPRMIWFFYEKLQIALPDSLLLTFTISSSFSEEEGKNIFTKLEKKIPASELTNRVLENIQQGIKHDYSRNQNYGYCFRYQLYEIYQSLRRDLCNSEIDYISRIDLFRSYIRLKRTERFAIQLLYQLKYSDLLFTVVAPEAFKEAGQQTIDWLLSGLKDRELSDEVNSEIIYHLVSLDQLEGVKALTNKILNNADGALFLRLTCLRSVKNSASIPYLIELLEHADREQTPKRQLYGLSQYVMEGLQSIALSKDAAFKQVLDALNQYIKHGKERDFIHLNIKNWEHQRDIARSNNLPISEAIQHINPIAPLTELEFIKLVNGKRGKELKKYRKERLMKRRLLLIIALFVTAALKILHQEIPYFKNTSWINITLTGSEITLLVLSLAGLGVYLFNASAYHKYMESLPIPEHLKALPEDVED